MKKKLPCEFKHNSSGQVRWTWVEGDLFKNWTVIPSTKIWWSWFYTEEEAKKEFKKKYPMYNDYE